MGSSVTVTLQAKTSAFNARMGKVIRTMETVRRRMEGISRAARRMLIAATAAATGAVVAFARFEQEMARVKGLTSATADEFKRLNQSARDLGKSTVFSATQAAQAMGAFALQGFKTNEIISAMPATLDLAAAGQLGMGQAASITSGIMKGMKLQVEDLAHVVDVLTLASTSAATDLPQLGEAMRALGPVAQSSGMSIEETMAILMGLADVMIRGSAAGTSLRNVLLRLQQNSKEVQKRMNELGLSIADSNGNMKKMSTIIDELNAALAMKDQVTRSAIIADIGGMRAVASLTEMLSLGGEQIREYTRNLQDSHGAARRLAQIQQDTLLGSFKLLTSALSELAIKFTGMFKPAIDAAVAATQALVEWFTRLESTTVKLTVAIGALGLALVGLVLPALALGLQIMAGTVLTLAGAYAVLAAALAKATAAWVLYHAAASAGTAIVVSSGAAIVTATTLVAKFAAALAGMKAAAAAAAGALAGFGLAAGGIGAAVDVGLDIWADRSELALELGGVSRGFKEIAAARQELAEAETTEQEVAALEHKVRGLKLVAKEMDDRAKVLKDNLVFDDQTPEGVADMEARQRTLGRAASKARFQARETITEIERVHKAAAEATAEEGAIAAKERAKERAAAEKEAAMAKFEETEFRIRRIAQKKRWAERKAAMDAWLKGINDARTEYDAQVKAAKDSLLTDKQRLAIEIQRFGVMRAAGDITQQEHDNLVKMAQLRAAPDKPRSLAGQFEGLTDTFRRIQSSVAGNAKVSAAGAVQKQTEQQRQIADRKEAHDQAHQNRLERMTGRMRDILEERLHPGFA